MIQQATVLREMKKPDAFDVEDIQNFIAGDQMRTPFIGPDRKIWGSALNEETRKAYSRELVVLRARKDMDTFSRVLGAKAIDWIMKCGGKRWKKVDIRFGTRAIHDETVYKLTFWLTSAIASILPVVSIVLLVKMESLNGRLGIIAAFNVLISICLTFFTEARRTDVFAVTAAYGSTATRPISFADHIQVRCGTSGVCGSSHRKGSPRSNKSGTQCYGELHMWTYVVGSLNINIRFRCTNLVVLCRRFDVSCARYVW